MTEVRLTFAFIHNILFLYFSRISKDKKLKKFANIIVIVPSAQIFVKRNFSDLKFICSDSRNCLSDDITQDISKNEYKI